MLTKWLTYTGQVCKSKLTKKKILVLSVKQREREREKQPYLFLLGLREIKEGEELRFEPQSSDVRPMSFQHFVVPPGKEEASDFLLAILLKIEVIQ